MSRVVVARVALAIRHAIETSQHNFGDRGTTETMVEAARAAIAAMREPTRGMMDAFYDEPCWGDGPEAADTWRAMIDEALKDE